MNPTTVTLKPVKHLLIFLDKSIYELRSQGCFGEGAITIQLPLIYKKLLEDYWYSSEIRLCGAVLTGEPARFAGILIDFCSHDLVARVFNTSFSYYKSNPANLFELPLGVEEVPVLDKPTSKPVDLSVGKLKVDKAGFEYWAKRRIERVNKEITDRLVLSLWTLYVKPSMPNYDSCLRSTKAFLLEQYPYTAWIPTPKVKIVNYSPPLEHCLPKAAGKTVWYRGLERCTTWLKIAGQCLTNLY